MANTITTVDIASVATTGPNGLVDITGVPTPGSSAISIAFAADTAAVVIAGTWSGRLAFEQTVDGINFAPVFAVSAADGSIVPSCTANGTYNVAKSRKASIRVRAIASISGSAVVSFTATGVLTGNPVLATGQVAIAVTGTAVQFPANALVNGVIVTAHGTNAASVVIGNSAVSNTLTGSGNGQELAAGASTSFAVTNTNQLWVTGTAGDWISFGGS